MRVDDCKIIKFYEDRVHRPVAGDIVDGFPANSNPSNLRICVDGRRSRCVYHKHLTETTESYQADLSLCMYFYRVDDENS